MNNKEKNNTNSIDKKFIDEKGLESTMHIENVNNNKIRKANYKIANFKHSENKKNFLSKDIKLNKKCKNIFTKDIGVKSNGFAQIASLSFIVAIAFLFIMYIAFKY